MENPSSEPITSSPTLSITLALRLVKQTSVRGLAPSRLLFFYLSLRFTCLDVLLGSRSISRSCFHSSSLRLCHTDTDKNDLQGEAWRWGFSLCADVDGREIPIAVPLPIYHLLRYNYITGLTSAPVFQQGTVAERTEDSKYARCHIRARLRKCTHAPTLGYTCAAHPKART